MGQEEAERRQEDLKERYDELVAKGKDKFEMVKKIMFLKHAGAHAATAFRAIDRRARKLIVYK